MHYSIQPNGSLKIIACNSSRADLAQAFSDGGYHKAESHVIDQIVGNGLSFVSPEQIGALTNAPIFGEGVYLDDAGQACLEPNARIWWYPQYETIDPWAQLKNTGAVEFRLAPAP